MDCLHKAVEWRDCELEGHEVDCYKTVCSECRLSTHRDCDEAVALVPMGFDRLGGTVNRDTDGTPYMTVRYIVEVTVIADNAEDALYHAHLAGPEAQQWSEGEVL